MRIRSLLLIFVAGCGSHAASARTTASQSAAVPESEAQHAASAGTEAVVSEEDEIEEELPEPEINACGVQSQFFSAAVSNVYEQQAHWFREHVASFLSAEDAERAVGALALEIRAALARGDYRALVPHLDPRGLCLRAAKGSDCRWMQAAELTNCRTSRARESWSVDTGSDDPFEWTCQGAMRGIFFADRRLRTAPPSFNCFPERNDNNGAPILAPEAYDGIYVEFHVPEDGTRRWRSLWLIFSHTTDGYRLVGMTSHYWGI